MTPRSHVEGSWPLVTDLVWGELRSYVAAASLPELQTLLTRCTPWTVSDLTAHLALTFRRFTHMLTKSRYGDLAPPFAPEELSRQNLLAVEAFLGDPVSTLMREANTFLELVHTPDELMAHQFGPIPVGLQVLFALSELAIHHHDVEEARGCAYRPADCVVAVLVPVFEQVLGGIPTAGDPWDSILVNSGRPPLHGPGALS